MLLIAALRRHRWVDAAMLLLVVGAGALTLGSCEGLTGPRDAHVFAPPAIYRAWWKTVERCSGTQKPFEHLTFFRVESKTIYGDANGLWTYGDNIYLTGESLRDGEIVRHEMLHAALNGGGHPASVFYGSCAGIVACDWPQCPDDGGTAYARPDTSSLPLSPDSFSVGVFARAPTGADSGWVSIVVSATNPHDYPVYATRQPGVTTFPVVRAYVDGLTITGLDATVGFAPRQTRSQVLDIRLPVDSSGTLRADHYIVGDFIHHYSPVFRLHPR